QQTMTAAGAAADLGRNRASGRRKALKLGAVGVVAVAVAALIWYSAVSAPEGTVHTGDRYGFKPPSAITVAGGHVWVANSGSVIEVDASNGRWMQTGRYGEYGITSNAAITSDGTDVWQAHAH